MGIWDSILNGVKNFAANGNNGAALNGNAAVLNPINSNVQNPQFGSAVVNGANTNIPQQTSQPTANKIVTALQNSSLRPSNWSDGTRQTISNILFGIGKSAMENPNQNPWVNVMNGANAGLQNQVAYKNAVNALGNYGLDTTGLTPYADYRHFTPEKIVALGVQQNRNRVRQEIAQANDNTKRLKLIMDGLRNNTITPEEAIAQAKIYGIDFNNLQESNDTARTNSQVQLNEARTEDIKNPKPRTTINIRKGGTKSTVNISHTGGNNGDKSKDDPLGLWK